jgi:hypothetical protein
MENVFSVWFQLGKDLGKVNLLEIAVDEKDLLNLIR